jgi:hypothetical protein
MVGRLKAVPVGAPVVSEPGEEQAQAVEQFGGGPERAAHPEPRASAAARARRAHARRCRRPRGLGQTAPGVGGQGLHPSPGPSSWLGEPTDRARPGPVAALRARPVTRSARPEPLGSGPTRRDGPGASLSASGW